MASNNLPQPGNGHDSVSSSAGLSISLSSNNPFRNRAASPNSLASPSSPFEDPPRARPVSRNPFIDQFEPPLKSPGAMSTNSEPKSLSAEEIFNSLTLDESKATDAKPQAKAASSQQPADGQRPPRGEKAPLLAGARGGGSHRPTRSQEEEMRARRKQGPGPGRAPGPHASRSPQRRPSRRPRRNSESSALDFNALTKEEIEMIQERRRQRERERQKRDAREGGEGGKSREPREPRDGSKTRGEEKDGEKGEKGEKSEKKRSGRRDKHRPSRRMDLIDQLDATSIYGTGLFHHDGPFDALNPHRNKNSSRRAPMQAFPKDSLNNTIGGAGPLNSNPDHALFMGRGNEEAFTDYARGGRFKNGYSYPESKGDATIFDPVARGSIVHGDESVGLGTSTFLEGTPAARSAIARRQAEQAQEPEGGLQRKKSLAQRIRHINKGTRDYSAGRNPETGYGATSPGNPGSAATAGSESNPFFSEFSKGEESITVKRRDGTLSPTSPPPRRGSEAGPALERRATTDATPSLQEAPAKPSGLLGRMKSLKGPKKPKAPEPSGPAPSESLI